MHVHRDCNADAFCSDCLIYRREKDIGTASGEWFKELLRDDAWFKDVVPNVRSTCTICLTHVVTNVLL